MRFTVLTVSAIFSTCVLAAENVALEASLGACIESRFDEARAPSINQSFKLSQACPLLKSALSKEGKALPMQESLGDETSLNQLMDLQSLLRAAKVAVPATTQFDFSGLKPLLASTLIAGPKPKVDWWQRFNEWMQAKLAQQDQTGDMSWLIKFLEKIVPPPWLAELLFKGAIGLILLLALIVIGNELRAGGGSFKWRSRLFARPQFGFRATVPKTEIPTLDGVLSLPLQQRPAALLKLVIYVLVERALLPGNAGLTNRELSANLKRSEQPYGSAFEHFILTLDPILYGGRQVSAIDMEALLQESRDLLGANYSGAK